MTYIEILGSIDVRVILWRIMASDRVGKISGKLLSDTVWYIIWHYDWAAFPSAADTVDSSMSFRRRLFNVNGFLTFFEVENALKSRHLFKVEKRWKTSKIRRKLNSSMLWKKKKNLKKSASYSYFFRRFFDVKSTSKLPAGDRYRIWHAAWRYDQGVPAYQV